MPVKRDENDIDLHRERVRGRIVQGLVAVLSTVVAAAVVGMLTGRLSAADLKDLSFALAPITTLATTAIAFYFRSLNGGGSLRRSARGKRMK